MDKITIPYEEGGDFVSLVNWIRYMHIEIYMKYSSREENFV